MIFPFQPVFFGLIALSAFAVALRAMGDILPAGAKDVIAVFFLDGLVVFERYIAVATKKSSHIQV